MSAADELTEFYVHQVAVTPHEGEGAYGDVMGTPYMLDCFVDESTKLVRNGAGEQVVSSARLTTAPGLNLRVGSRVTLPSGRTSTVLSVAHRDSGLLDLPDHTEIVLE